MKALSKSSSVTPEAKDIIKKLKSGDLEIHNVPEEFALDPHVLKSERTLGLRKSGHRGSDVLTQMFFVEEDWFHRDLLGNPVPILHTILWAN